MFQWLLENFELHMWLAFVAYITFLLDHANLSHYNAITTIIVEDDIYRALNCVPHTMLIPLQTLFQLSLILILFIIPIL